MTMTATMPTILILREFKITGSFRKMGIGAICRTTTVISLEMQLNMDNYLITVLLRVPEKIKAVATYS